MKKIVSLVGVGAMVISLGLGSAFAQQTTPTVTTPPAASEKDKAPVVKPSVAMKDDKAVPAKTPDAVVKPGLGAKSEAIAPVKEEIGKAAEMKPAIEKADKAGDLKPSDEKKDAKVEPAKVKPEDAEKKLDEAKPVKK